MLPYAETLMPRWKKLTTDSMPAPFHFSNFERSVFDSSEAILHRRFAAGNWKASPTKTQILCYLC